MENPLVLTFDIGTQSARALLVTADGLFEDIVQDKYSEPYFSKNPGWAEQRPDYYYDRICGLAKILMGRNPDKKDRIIAVTITTIRDTVLCLDKDYKPIRDIIVWLDKRRAAYNNPFGKVKESLFKLVGMGRAAKTIYQASAVNWIMQNEPEIWKKTEKFVMLPTYLNYKFTGKLVDSVANMIGHMPFNYKNRTWMKPGELTSCIYDISRSKLCDLVPSGTVIGTILKSICDATGIPEGLPLIATGSDKGCETLGLSVIKSNQAAISFGTTATIQMAVKKYFEPQQFMPAYPAVPNDMYNPEIEIYRGFWLLSWFVKEFGENTKLEAQKLGCSAEMLLDKEAARIAPGCDGLMVQPFWTPGIMNPDSLGAVLGFSDFHTRAHLYRAIIEGLDYELYHALKKMEKRSGLKIDELFLGGGGAKSDLVCQITADIFGIPVKRIQTHEASSIGASMVAFVAKGIYGSYEEAIKGMVREKDVFKPNIQNHELYQKLYKKAYNRIETHISPINKSIMEIYKRR